GERAGWVVGAVEVEIDGAVDRQRRVQEAAGFVGFLAAGQVLEDEEQVLLLRRLVDRLETIRLARLPRQRELDVAGTLHLHNLPEYVGHRHLLRRRVRGERGAHAIGGIEREVLQALEGRAGDAVGIEHAQADLRPAADREQRDAAARDPALLPFSRFERQR